MGGGERAGANMPRESDLSAICRTDDESVGSKGKKNQIGRGFIGRKVKTSQPRKRTTIDRMRLRQQLPEAEQSQRKAGTSF